MATWSELRQRGYGVLYSVTIEGIPYVFTERRCYRVDSAAEPGVPSGYTLSRALSVLEGDEVSVEINRETGIADGRAWDITLAWDVLERESLLSALFTTPSATATLTTALTTGAETTISVDDTTDFASSGTAWIGRECFSYTGKTGTSFTTVTRGVAGLAHYHDTSSWVSYNVVSDVPIYWRGRLVTLYQHLVSPEGRILDSTIGQVGTYSRQLWRGFVAEEPRPSAQGMQLRCLLLVRLLEREIGYEARGEVIAGERMMDAPIGISAADTITVTVDDGAATTATLPETIAALTTRSIRTWAAEVMNAASSVSWGGSWAGNNPIEVNLHEDKLTLLAIGTSIDSMTCVANAWFLQPRNIQVVGTEGIGTSPTTRPWSVHYDVELNVDGAWLSIRFEDLEDGQQLTIPTAGFVRIESGGSVELAYYDDLLSLGYEPRNKAIRLARRGINGVRVNAWRDGGTVSIVTGYVGPVWEALETMLTSSGISTLRGTYDSLAFGLGLGLPASYIETARTRSVPNLTSDYAWLASDGRASIAELLGGWFAATSTCLVQRRDPGDDAVKITIADTIPAKRAATSGEERTDTLDDTNVLIGSHSTPAPVPAPNSIKVDLSVEGREPITAIVQDVARIQAEGKEQWELTASGMTSARARLHGQSLLASMEGQAIVELAVPPHVEIQIGDPVALDTAHPASYDWGGATRAPSSVPARVLGWRYSLYSERATLTLATDARSLGPRYLCPTLTVSSRDAADTISITGADPRDWLEGGESVLIYTPGDEASESQTLVISTMTSTTIVFTTSTVGAWVASGARVTFPTYTSGSARQQAWAYVRSDTRWR